MLAIVLEPICSPSSWNPPCCTCSDNYNPRGDKIRNDINVIDEHTSILVDKLEDEHCFIFE